MKASSVEEFLLPAPLLTTADLGVLQFSNARTLEAANPTAREWLGIPDPRTTSSPASALDAVLVACVARASESDGGVATGTMRGRHGEPLLIAASQYPPGAGTSVACLLRRVPTMGSNPPPLELELLEAMVDAAQDGLTIVTGTGVVLHLNTRAAELDGVRKEELVGRNIADLVRAGYYDHSITLEVMRRRVDVTMVQTVRDGRKLVVTGRPIFAADGTLKYVVLTDRDITELNRVMTRLEETARLSDGYRAELRRVEMRELETGNIVARTERMRAVHELALRCAAVDSPVLILGETGSGKGVFAKLIHRASARNSGPFLEVNCGAIPEGLVEAELFGYARGAFTGADPKGKVGLIDLADQGTLLLNEIGDLPPPIQVKLLRFLEDGEIQPVGAVKARRPNVRIIAATNRNLAGMIARGAFRQDLFYRLNVLTIDVPPLRDRQDDIPWLIDMMLTQLERKLHRYRRFSPAALKLLTEYVFPGNVRELWNLVERLVVTTDAETIDAESLPFEVAGASDTGFSEHRGTYRQGIQRAEVAILKQAMERYGSQTAAAKHLGLGQATISRKLSRYGLTARKTGAARRAP